MPTTKDAETWFGEGGMPEDHQDAFDLYQASDGTSVGRYTAHRRRSHVFISCDKAGTLHLRGVLKVRAFRKELKRYNPFPEMGWLGAEDWIRQMSKDD